MKRRTGHRLTRFVKVAEKSDLREGFSKVVSVEGRSIALFRVKDEYFALANVCLHRGGALGGGNITDKLVTCPQPCGWLVGPPRPFSVIATNTITATQGPKQDR